MKKLKKILLCSMTALTLVLAQSINVSAADLGTQSKNVTVGEVDTIDANDHEQDTLVPDTGIFTSNIGEKSVLATAIIIPVVIALIFLARCTLKK